MPINWVDVPDPHNPPNGAPKLSAANLARLALIEDIGTAGTPTGDALKAAYAPAVKTVQAQQLRSTSDGTAALAAATPPPFGVVTSTGPTDVVVNPGETYQELYGGGAALSDAAAYCLTNYLAPAARTALLTELYSPAGCNWGIVRIGIGGTDFQSGGAAGQYTYDDMPAGQTDPNLMNFSISPDGQRLLPLLQQIMGINPRTRVFAAVWSLPTWMLATGSAFTSGATFNTANVGAWAQYIVRFVQGYAGYGVPIYAVSIQNEPLSQMYTSMSVSVQQQCITALGAAFDAAGLDVKILAHEENWAGSGNVTSVLADATTSAYTAGVAWHGYTGRADAMTYIRRRFPSLEQHLTEWRALQTESAAVEFQGMAGGFVAQGIRNWARSVILWNLALDQNGNPTVTSTGRRGVLTIDNTTGAITRNPAYYAMTHLTKWLQPGARRCRSTSYSAPYVAYTTLPTDVTTAAFTNTDGSVVLYAYNGAAADKTFQVIDGRSGQGFPVTLASGEVSTFVWGTSVQAAPVGAPASGGAPSTPTLTATGGKGEAQLSWSAPTSAWPVIGYTVLRGPAGSEVPVMSLPATAASFKDYVAAGSYSYKLRATSRAGSSTSAAAAATVAAATAPAAPTVGAPTVTGNKVTLALTPGSTNGSPSTGIQVWRGTASGTETLLATAPKGATSYDDFTGTTGTLYYYVAKDVNATGVGPASNEVTAIPANPTVTASPPVLAQTTSVATGGTLSWAHTITAGDTVLAVLLSTSLSTFGDAISAVTYGGQAMARQASASSTAGGTAREVAIYTLVNPPVGAANVVVTPGAGTSYSMAASSVSLQGAAGTYGTPATAATASGTTLTATATSVTGAFVLGVASARSTSALTVSGSPTSLRNDVVGTNLADAQFRLPGAASVPATVTWTTADAGALALLSVA